MNPDLDVRSVEEQIQASSVVEMKVSYYDFLDITNAVSSSFYGSIELVTRIVLDSCEDIRDLRAPHRWIVLATASLPKDDPFDGVVYEHTVHRESSSFVHK